MENSGYVLKRGLEEKRDQFDLLLHCIMIITSVVPPELNMHLALAVNSSILTLIKIHVFCTEPFRVVLAGKAGFSCSVIVTPVIIRDFSPPPLTANCLGNIDSCLFDKTGTITTDELVADRIVAVDPVCRRQS